MSKEQILTYLKSPATNLRFLYVFSYASGTAWVPFFGLFLKDKGLGGSSIGYISSLIWVVMLLFQPVWGVKADQKGRVQSFRLSLIMTMFLLVLFFFFGNTLVSIIFCTVLCSLFYIAILPLLDALVLDHIESHNSGLSYGNFRFWGALGASIGAQSSSIVNAHFSSEYIFITGALFLLLSLPFAFRLKNTEAKTDSLRIEFKNIRTILNDRVLFGFLMVILIVSIAQTSIWYYLTIYLKDIGASDYIAGSAITVDGISELPFYFLAALLFRKIGLKYTILLSFAATAIRLFLYSVNDLPIAVLFIETSNGLSWTLMWVASVEYVNRLVKPEWRATGQSLLWAAYFGAGQIIGNIWIGHLYEKMSMKAIYGLNSGIVLVAILVAIMVFFVLEKGRKPEISV